MKNETKKNEQKIQPPLLHQGRCENPPQKPSQGNHAGRISPVIWKSEFTGFTWLISEEPPRITGLPREIVSRINNKGMKTT